MLIVTDWGRTRSSTPVTPSKAPARSHRQRRRPSPLPRLDRRWAEAVGVGTSIFLAARFIPSAAPRKADAIRGATSLVKAAPAVLKASPVLPAASLNDCPTSAALASLMAPSMVSPTSLAICSMWSRSSLAAADSRDRPPQRESSGQRPRQGHRAARSHRAKLHRPHAPCPSLRPSRRRLHRRRPPGSPRLLRPRLLRPRCLRRPRRPCQCVRRSWFSPGSE